MWRSLTRSCASRAITLTLSGRNARSSRASARLSSSSLRRSCAIVREKSAASLCGSRARTSSKSLSESRLAPERMRSRPLSSCSFDSTPSNAGVRANNTQVSTAAAHNPALRGAKGESEIAQSGRELRVVVPVNRAAVKSGKTVRVTSSRTTRNEAPRQSSSNARHAQERPRIPMAIESQKALRSNTSSSRNCRREVTSRIAAGSTPSGTDVRCRTIPARTTIATIVTATKP